MARYTELSPAEMNPAQKAVVDEIVSGKRAGSVAHSSC